MQKEHARAERKRKAKEAFDVAASIAMLCACMVTANCIALGLLIYVAKVKLSCKPGEQLNVANTSCNDSCPKGK